MRRLTLIATLLVLPAAAQAQVLLVEPGTADCSTPRRALETWLNNLQVDSMHPRQATRCFDWAGVSVHEHERQQRLATQLKRVLDGRAIYVEMEEISDEPDQDEDELRPFPHRLEGFSLEKKGERWLISAETIRQIAGWYEATEAFDVDAILDVLPAWVHETVFGFAWWQILGLALFVALAFLLRFVVARLVATQGTRLSTRVVKSLDARLLERMAQPAGTAVMMVSLSYALPPLRLGIALNRVLIFGLQVGAAVAAVVVVYRLVDVAADVFAKRAEDTETKLDDQLVPLLRKSAKVVTVIVGVIFILQNMEVDVGSLLATASIGALAFSLAARDTIANLFGSVSIFADQPFQVGDWVKMQDVEGVVEEVGMRSTRVRTFYKSLVSIPNSKVADGIIDNLGRRTARRVFVKLGLQYDSTPEQIQAFCDGIRAILSCNEAVDDELGYQVWFSGFGDSALEIMLYFFFQTDSWEEELRNRHNIFLETLRLAKELKVEFAFPTRTLHLTTRAKETVVEPNPEPPVDELRAAVLAFGPGGALARPEGPTITHGFFPGAAAAAVEPEDVHRDQGDDPDADVADSRE